MQNVGVYNIGMQIKFNTLITEKHKEKVRIIEDKVVCMAMKRLRKKKFSSGNVEIFKNWNLKTYGKKTTSYKETENLKYCYVFENGSVIFWNFTDDEEKEILGLIANQDIKKMSYSEDKFNYLERHIYEHDQSAFVKNYVAEGIIFLTVFLLGRRHGRKTKLLVRISNFD